MLRRPAVNLNRQSQDATILLIREILNSGIQITEVSMFINCMLCLNPSGLR